MYATLSDRQVAVIAVLVVVLVSAIAGGTISLPQRLSGGSSKPDTSSHVVNGTERVAQLHESGITGATTTVGVIDVTGFDLENPAIEDQVMAARSFAPGETIQNNGRNGHGTAAASLVAQTAPNATLYLASFDTADGYQDAVVWLLRQDVDVIVAPVSFYGKPGDGSSRIARIAELATAHGAVFVASAGNLGRGHWGGSFAPRNGTHRFEGGTRNYLLNGDGQRVELWLSWEHHSTARNLTLDLYWTNGEQTRLVARSVPYRGDTIPNERINARVRNRGTYYVTVEGPQNASGTRIEITSPTHVFQFRTRTRSVVAPATAATAITVGAYDTQKDRVEPFSSAGPVGDRVGVDLVAPDRLRTAGDTKELVGSSAAAPYVGGVAALVLESDPTLSPSQVETVVTATATDVGQPGTDPIAGSGLIDPRRAVERAKNTSET